MNDIRIAAVIMNCPVGRVQDNLDRMAGWIRTAKKRAADLVCFPEMNVTGYSNRVETKDSAETVPGTISQSVLALAREFKLAILAGLLEKDARGRVFASQLVVTPRGVAGIYRKIHIAPPETDVFSAGDTVALFKIKGVKLGIQLCYDVHFPELSTRMATDGADVIFMPHASPRGTPAEKFNSWMRHLPARAFDNGLYVVACNQTGNNQSGLNFPGVSVVLDPAGRIIKKNTGGKEDMVVANLEADELEKVRGHRMRYFLPNRRPDLY
ncbi:MAG: nitrilase [Desulfobacterales bacterium]|nr:nitrilase [Desulfobacterales bacterium]